MGNKVLLTAASGTLGRAILQALRAAGIPVRQGMRDTAKATQPTDVVHFDYTDPGSIAPALQGVTALVLIAPPLEAKAPELLEPVIEAAKAAKVQQLVLISAFGVDHNEQAPMRIVEHLVIRSGVPYTILRPNFFMENFSEGAQAGGRRHDNAIFLAAEDAKTSFISVRDVAAVVATALKDSLTGVEIDLTGPDALSHSEVAAIISSAAGRIVTYNAITEQDMLQGARSHGMPEPIVQYLAMLYRVVRAGHAASIAPVPAALAAYRPRSFRTFAGQADWSTR